MCIPPLRSCRRASDCWPTSISMALCRGRGSGRGTPCVTRSKTSAGCSHNRPSIGCTGKGARPTVSFAVTRCRPSARSISTVAPCRSSRQPKLPSSTHSPSLVGSGVLELATEIPRPVKIHLPSWRIRANMSRTICGESSASTCLAVASTPGMSPRRACTRYSTSEPARGGPLPV